MATTKDPVIPGLFSPGDKIGRGISFIIYAAPGVGKTTMATTLPEGETIFINVEGGLGPLLGTKHVVMNLSNVEDMNLERRVEELYKTLRTESHPFKYVIIDNLSELEQQLLLFITRSRGKDVPELREHGDVAYKMKEWVRLFRDLTQRGITVVFNAWEFPIELKNISGEIKTQIFPMCGKKLSPQICGIVDIVGHLEVHEKTGKRWVRLGPSDQYITKTQFKGLDLIGEIADFPTILDKLMAYNYANK